MNSDILITIVLAPAISGVVLVVGLWLMKLPLAINNLSTTLVQIEKNLIITQGDVDHLGIRSNIQDRILTDLIGTPIDTNQIARGNQPIPKIKRRDS